MMQMPPRLLIVKTSSMGDVIHTFPAITRLLHHAPNWSVDWVVEEGFADLAGLHPFVSRVIPVRLRRWRRNFKIREIKDFLKTLRRDRYDVIIDAQGLLKSAVITRLARGGGRYGLDAHSARGRSLGWAYDQRIAVPTGIHAIHRVERLFAHVFGFALKGEVNYGLSTALPTLDGAISGAYLVFFQATTWESKLWPERYWVELGLKAHQAGYAVKLNAGNPTEFARAQRIAAHIPHAQAMPPQGILEWVSVIRGAAGVVSVDTGLGHLSAALDKPGVGIYGSTHPGLTGMLGTRFVNVAATRECSPCLERICPLNAEDPPCYQTVSPEQVWGAFTRMLAVDPVRSVDGI
jgi:heptosyltransferase-1